MARWLAQWLELGGRASARSCASIPSPASWRTQHAKSTVVPNVPRLVRRCQTDLKRFRNNVFREPPFMFTYRPATG